MSKISPYLSTVLTILLGALGGYLAQKLHLPLAWMLGSLVAVAIAAICGVDIKGVKPRLPAKLRICFVPIIGVSIGGNFTADVLRQAVHWWPSVLALAVFIPLVHWLGYRIYRFGGLGKPEAFFGSIPGGLIESVQLGEAAGADVRMLTVLQFLRLILTIIAVPTIFTLLTGHAVGSAAGLVTTGASIPLTITDIAVLFACGLVGALGGRAIGMPAWQMVGPLIASGVAHVLGWVEGVPPAWLLASAQVVLGAGLGARFFGVDHAYLRRGLGLAAVNAVVCLGMAFAFALLLAPIVEQPASGVFLAYAPGGVAEMGLIALSLNVSPIFVTVHHVLRIGMAVVAAQFGARRMKA